MIPFADCTQAAALATLRAAGEPEIAWKLLGVPPEKRGRVAARSWLDLAIHRPRWIGGGLLRAFMLRAISDWASAVGASVDYVEVVACPPEGCLCARCAHRALHDIGYKEAADTIYRGGDDAVRAGYMGFREWRARAESKDVRRLEAAILAVEHIAVARGVDLEEWA